MLRFSILIILCQALNAFSQCGLDIAFFGPVWCLPCSGSASASVTAGVPPFSFEWSNGQTTPYLFDLCEGTYTVTVTDSIGCVATGSITLELPPTMTVTFSTTAASCPGCCDACIYADIQGGSPPYSFSFEPPLDLPCNACAFTTYMVTITDAQGCELQTAVTPDTTGTTGLPASNGFLSHPGLKLRPNPVNNHLFLEMSDNTHSISARVDITNLMGKQIESFRWDDIRLPIFHYFNHLPSGIYICHVSSSDRIWTTKFVVQ